MKKIILTTFFTFCALYLYGEDSVKLTFAGDLMSHDVNYKTTPLSDIYKGVTEQLLTDDLSFINLEFPVDETRPYSSYPSFNVKPEYIKAAIDAGFDVFALGNNHTNDFGYNSVLKTVKNMEQFKDSSQIIYSGVYANDSQSFTVETIQVKNLTIGFISITQFSNNNVNKKGADSIVTVNYNSLSQSKKLLDFINSVSDDFDCLIVGYHGGKEYKPEPSPRRKEFFKEMIEAGADIIWGHHPHVLQPWEKIEKDDGDKLIMYSMGNFVSGQLAIVDPVNHNGNFAATGFSALFNVDLNIEDGVLRMDNLEPKMTANIRNKNRFFTVVYKDDALNAEMSDDWKNFYNKMFKVVENRIRE